MKYNAAVLEHFWRPRHSGRLAPDPARVVSGAAGRVETGARVAIDIALAAGTVANIRWRAFGCPHLVAATSLLADRALGMPLELFRELQPISLAEHLELPPDKLGLMLVLEDALHAAADRAQCLAQSGKNTEN